MTKQLLDPIHNTLLAQRQPISTWVWDEKYRNGTEHSIQASIRRAVRYVMADESPKHLNEALLLCEQGLFIPGGRILAGAGTKNIVTLLNCFMSREIGDSMEEIADALKDAMLTQQQGGGIGMNFSTLRPNGAYLKRTGAVASGPLPFMDMWDSMCSTIMSAGSRRGAMMGVMHCEHPDLPTFIEAKGDSGRFTNFNLSVLITDAFMAAVSEDADWYLGFTEPPMEDNELGTIDREDIEGTWYVYSKWRARDLWDMIIKHTYEYAEPGVIFIDSINDRNNLKYCETIQGTNPCGEIPLPYNGMCCLGAVNLAFMVSKPFTVDAEFSLELLARTVKLGVRFLDNVLDKTNYPLEVQRKEAMDKRRIGLGITGLADVFNFLGMRYGSSISLALTERIMSTITTVAYQTSMEIAKEKGCFPLFEPESFGEGDTVFNKLSPELQSIIRTCGIRNGVLLTIAPTGTTSLLWNNISGGLEPVFAYEAIRKVRQSDGSFEDHEVKDYSRLVWDYMYPEVAFPTHCVDTSNLQVSDHLRVQALCQKYIDASISKTINCPPEMSFEEFQLVYWDAYSMGCKGCTTYRPNSARGSILRVKDEEDKGVVTEELPERPEVLAGKTYKLKWPSIDGAIYVTVNGDNERPLEIFISSTSAKYADWTTALTLMISAIMRKGGDISFIPHELKKVVSATDSAWIGKKYYGSLVALIGCTLEKHLEGSVDSSELKTMSSEDAVEITNILMGTICPQCNAPSLIKAEGCDRCTSCDYSKCG